MENNDQRNWAGGWKPRDRFVLHLEALPCDNQGGASLSLYAGGVKPLSGKGYDEAVVLYKSGDLLAAQKTILRDMGEPAPAVGSIHAWVRIRNGRKVVAWQIWRGEHWEGGHTRPLTWPERIAWWWLRRTPSP